MDTSGIRPHVPKTEGPADTREGRQPAAARRPGHGAQGTTHERDSVELTTRAHAEASRVKENSQTREHDSRIDERRRAAALRTRAAATEPIEDEAAAGEVAKRTRTRILASPELAAHAQANSHSDAVLEMLR